MLHFTALWPLFALPAALLPLLLYWWRKRQKRRQTFPSLQLIRQTAAEQARRLRLREILLLALRILALAALILAAAGPVIRSDSPLSGAPERVVALLDRSLSMTAVDGEGERFERAKRACARYLKLLPAGTRVDLVAFDERPRLIVEGAEPAEATAALGEVEAGLGGTNIAAALEFAAFRLRRSGEEGVAVLFSDLPAGCIAEPLDYLHPLLLYPAGLDAPNGGITELALQNPLPLAGVELELVAEATGPPRDYRLFMNGREVSAREQAAGRFTMSAVPVEPGWTVFRLAAEPADPFGVDDVRWLAVRAHPAPRVYTLGEAGLFGTALDTAPGLAERSAEPFGAQVILWDARKTLVEEEASLVRSLVEKGAGLFIALPPEEGLQLPPWSGVGPPVRRAAPSGHRLGPSPENDVTRPLSGPLTELTRSEVAGRIAVPALDDEWRVLFRYSGGETALAYRELGAGRLLLWLLPFRLEDGAFAATEAFPALFNQALRLCAFGEHRPATHTAGTSVNLEFPSGGVLLAPDGGELTLEGGRSRKLLLDRAGEWRLESPEGERAFAVNPPPGEGRLTTLDPDRYALFGPNVRVLDEGTLAGEGLAEPFPLWRLLLALTALLLVVELALADARWR